MYRSIEWETGAHCLQRGGHSGAHDQLWRNNLLASRPSYMFECKGETYLGIFPLYIQTYKSERGYKDSSVEHTDNVLLVAVDQPTRANVDDWSTTGQPPARHDTHIQQTVVTSVHINLFVTYVDGDTYKIAAYMLEWSNIMHAHWTVHQLVFIRLFL